MKKDQFKNGLKNTLHWRVELKNPKNFDEAVEVAKNKTVEVGRYGSTWNGSRDFDTRV